MYRSSAYVIEFNFIKNSLNSFHISLKKLIELANSLHSLCKLVSAASATSAEILLTKETGCDEIYFNFTKCIFLLKFPRQSPNVSFCLYVTTTKHKSNSHKDRDNYTVAILYKYSN